MHYSDNPRSVQVVIFKPNGKYYTTIPLIWDKYDNDLDTPYETLSDILRRCIKEQYDSFGGMWAVCLEPYHKNAHPQMVMI